MGSLADSESTAKLADSAYSNSSSNSNSRSRRSRSSKSTRSGSHSSGSSGYGGIKLSGSNGLDQTAEMRIKDKHGKMKRCSKTGTLTDATIVETETRPEDLGPMNVDGDLQVSKPEDDTTPATEQEANKAGMIDQVSFNAGIKEEAQYKMEATASHHQNSLVSNQMLPSTSLGQYWPTLCSSPESFSCVITMNDGVVIYTTDNMSYILGFKKDMWAGRSFIDFVHPEDRNTFASQILSGIALPKNMQEHRVSSAVVSMCCRIRNYRGVTTAFSRHKISFKAFELKVAFKDVFQERGVDRYIVLQATQLISAFKRPNEVVNRAKAFVIRHAANGKLEYVDPESASYMGYLPQDLIDKDALLMYHPEDLMYIQTVYETVVREGSAPKTRTYRMLTQNGDYLKIETEFSRFVKPWCKNLEFVCGKHHIIEGPSNPDVFMEPGEDHRFSNLTNEMGLKSQAIRDDIVKIMIEASTNSLELVRQRASKRCLMLANVMKTLTEEPAMPPPPGEELRLDMPDAENSCYERDSVMLGGISPHHENESKASTETLLSYNQLNYNETLQRYFDSYEPASQQGSCDLSPPEHTQDMDVEMFFNTMESSEGAGTSHSGERTLSKFDAHCRLSESIIVKHNNNMEKDLVSKHRELHPNSKSSRESVLLENRQKKKDHLARCNAPYQPTEAEGNVNMHQQAHGMKRRFTVTEPENFSSKHHCSVAETNRQNYSGHYYDHTRTTGAAIWTKPPATTPTYVHNVQQGPIISPLPVPAMPATPGMVSVYYVPTTEPSMHMQAVFPSTSGAVAHTQRYQTPPVAYPYLYPQPVMGPFVYSSVAPHAPHARHAPHAPHAPQAPLAPHSPYPPPAHRLLVPAWTEVPYQPRMEVPYQPRMPATMAPRFALPLTNDNYEEACKWYAVGRPCAEKARGGSDSAQQGSAVSSSAVSSNNRVHSGKHAPEKDMESSSSFCSSFFYTESGSTSESDNKNNMGPPPAQKQMLNRPPAWQVKQKAMRQSSFSQYREKPVHISSPPRSFAKPKPVASPDMMYKFQINTKCKSEVLVADKKRIDVLKQPPQVDEQLSQLYLDLHLEQVPAGLTIAEGITSSSSSGEETMKHDLQKQHKVNRRKHSRLGLIFEEDAPLPPPAPVEGAPTPAAPTPAPNDSSSNDECE